ncbi:putative mediator of RNA polymerase II transcription subunit 26c [Heracleum sosnowskyi]|uniref:Mediator of RNA polymerase II transcription subunit 26c n=1 Tax=Heracleum sosnowskyi TaxID=360622 RepID=A0AAD8MFJ4_9APIA|nr:putative mediator of RNA polymerase II transcription subunit 26c [Heracleum sosnowskyi]
MDSDEFRRILSNSAVDIWSFIDAAISVASSDYGHELKDRRDEIVQRLYACRNCGDEVVDHRRIVQPVMKVDNHQAKLKHSPYTPQSVHREDDVEVDVVNDDDDEEEDPYAGLFDDEETRILRIKEQIEDPEQTEDSLVDLLQGLADMDITFKGLKETDIGRYVNRLRKHESSEVRRLVKQLVRKWKDLVDEWVKLNPPEIPSSTIIADGESPMNMRRNLPNGHQVPDFAYSPNPNNGSSGSERNNSEPEQKPKSVPRREVVPKPAYRPTAGSASAPLNRPPPPKETAIDPDRLASARRRLHENYQEAQNAKKQRTIQVMDIHEIPKPKNGYIAKNKGGFHGRNHR